MKTLSRTSALLAFGAVMILILAQPLPALEKTPQGSHGYDQFETSKGCSGCHPELYRQWESAAMARSYTLAWDQAEYFKLAYPQSQVEPKVAPVEAGCINCHAPLAYLAGDIPPQPAAANTRANEGVSCDLCHVIIGGGEGFEPPFNGSFVVRPGKVKYGNRQDAKPIRHQAAYSEYMTQARFCANCHDEQSPYGAWVKETYREWEASPYGAANIRCQDCHMPRGRGKAAATAKVRRDLARHLFLGANSPEWLRGAVVVAIYPDRDKVEAGRGLDIEVAVSNVRAGHMVPTGSTEERQLWLRLEAVDASGRTHHIAAPLAEGDTAAKSWSVTTNRPAYFDLGEIMKLAGYKGIARDAVGEGDRIYRKVFLDPKGRMTVCQWYAADTTSFDNRLAPLESRLETYRWTVPDNVPPGKLLLQATLSYRRLPQSVADVVGIGKVRTVEMARAEAQLEVVK